MCGGKDGWSGVPSSSTGAGRPPKLKSFELFECTIIDSIRRDISFLVFETAEPSGAL